MPQKPIYSPEDEQKLMAFLWSPEIVNDPLAYVMSVYPWGQENTPLANKKGPRAWQRKVLLRIKTHIARQSTFTSEDLYEVLQLARVSGRGIGKSALVSWLSGWFRDCHIGASVLISANSESQLRSVTWAELSKWTAMSINAHWWEVSATKITPATWLSELVERDLKKSTRYWSIEGKLWSEENPDGYAGPHNHDGMMVIFDEASGIADGIWPVAGGYFTEPIQHRYWLAFSNGRRNTGYFFECFNSKREFWDNDQIDARTVEDTDKKVYQKIIDEYGEDSNEARVEVYGQFPKQGESQFIALNVVEDAMKREYWPDVSAPIVLGVDPARSGADNTVIVVRQGRNILEIRRFSGDDTMVVAGHIIQAIREFNPALTVIDEGGLGYGPLDRVTEQNFPIRGVSFQSRQVERPDRHFNKRAEMWDNMRLWLKTASIPKDPRLKTDLLGVRDKPSSTGAVQLEGKREMRARGLASPDCADAIAVTFAYPVWVEDDYDDVHMNYSQRDRECSRIGGY